MIGTFEAQGTHDQRVISATLEDALLTANRTIGYTQSRVMVKTLLEKEFVTDIPDSVFRGTTQEHRGSGLELNVRKDSVFQGMTLKVDIRLSSQGEKDSEYLIGYPLCFFSVHSKRRWQGYATKETSTSLPEWLMFGKPKVTFSYRQESPRKNSPWFPISDLPFCFNEQKKSSSWYRAVAYATMILPDVLKYAVPIERNQAWFDTGINPKFKPAVARF